MLPAARGPDNTQPGAAHGSDQTKEDRWLALAIARWQARFPDTPVKYERVGGRPGAVLVARSTAAVLTVVGGRGCGGFAGLLLGSVSQQLLHHAASPLAVLHAH